MAKHKETLVEAARRVAAEAKELRTHKEQLCNQLSVLRKEAERVRKIPKASPRKAEILYGLIN